MAWQFFRRLSKVQAISFDLDDTLYANAPVMAHAEQFMIDYLAEHAPETPRLTVGEWRQKRMALAKLQPELGSDMSALRETCLLEFMQAHRVSNAKEKVAQAMAAFFEVRNQITLKPEIRTLLASLSKRFPLIAISNGNADIQRMGLGDYFSAAFKPGPGVRGKPYSDMFELGLAHLKLKSPSALLHIGDHPISDVEGALKFGAQAVWFDGPFRPAGGRPATRTLPHARITELSALELLIDR